MVEMLSYKFMQNAFIAGLMISVACASISNYVLLKRLSFIGVGISHSAFGGVALGILAGLNPIGTAIFFTIAVALAIGFVSRGASLHEDTVIGMFFVFTMSLGTIFIGLSKGYSADIFGYLFGSILSVTRSDLISIALLCMVVMGVLFAFSKEFFYLSFDEEMAQVSGLPVQFLYQLLLALIALTVVVAIKIVGIVLVSALLVLPAATSFQWTKSFRAMFALSILFAIASSTLGLYFSYALNLASGATIVLVSILMFFGSFFLSPRRKQAR